MKLFKTKTFWTGLAGIVAGIGLCAAGDFGNGVATIIAGALGITGRDAISKIEKAQQTLNLAREKADDLK